MDHTHMFPLLHLNRSDEDSRPSKHRRVVASPPHRQPQPNHSDSDSDSDRILEPKPCPLRALVRAWNQVPLSAFFESERVETIAQEISRLLGPSPSQKPLHASKQTSFYEDRVLAQVHGLLLQWLDFAVSSQKVRDITVEDYEYDNVTAKVKASVLCIARCLQQLYEVSPWNLLTPEVLAILIRALLKLKQCHTSEMVKHDLPIDASSSFRALLIVLEISLRPNNVGTTGIRDSLCAPLGVRIEFLLCLVQAWTTGVTEGTEDMDPLNRRTGDFARAIVSHLVQPRQDTTQPSSESLSHHNRGRIHNYGPNFLATIASVVMHEAKPIVAISAVNTASLFGLQCILRRGTSECCFVDTANVISILLEAVLRPISASLDALTRYQAIDCLVALSQHHEQSPTWPSSVSSKLLSAFMHILADTSSTGTPRDAILKLKAVEGLQFILLNGDSMHLCVSFLTHGTNPFATMKAFLTSMMDAINYRCHRHVCEFPDADPDSWIDLSTNSVVIAASEMLLSVICLSFHEVSQSVSQSQLVSICIQLLQLQAYCEHIAYLTIRAICHEHPAKFVDIVQVYPELLTSLADVLCYPDVTASTEKSILGFFTDLLDVRPVMTTVLVRQPRVLEAISSVASKPNDSSSSSNSESVERRRMAATVLFVLSTDVCNRRILARHARVLSSMMSFVRDHAAIPLPLVAAAAAAAAAADGHGGRGVDGRAMILTSPCHRHVWKERILQLAAVL